MKYLYLNPAAPNDHLQALIPVDGPVTIKSDGGLWYLCIGDKPIFDVDENNRPTLIAFLADAFSNSDIATINLHSAPIGGK